MDGFKKLNFLSNDENGKVVVDIPVITMKDRRNLYNISKKYSDEISNKFQDELMKLMENKVKTPAHLKSVPDWQKYMYCCATFPMRVILKAKDKGLFLKGYNIDNYPVPAIFIAVEK